MIVKSSRFDILDVPDTKVITLSGGLIGFPSATRFVIVERGSAVVWLQSVDDPTLAFPVVEATRIRASYPDRPLAEIAESAGLGEGRWIAMLVVHVAEGALCANLLAPVLVDLETLRGGQVVLDPEEYDTSVPLSAIRTPAVSARGCAEPRPNQQT